MAPVPPGSHRIALALSTSASAVLLAWAAWVLPSQPGSLPALLAALLCLAHMGAFLVALVRPRYLRPVWRVLSWISLATGTLLATLIAITACAMVERFGGLGIGVAALLGALGVLVLLATVPFAAWGLSVTRRPLGGD
ncbi:MAG: hypothetical protein RL685_6687 [Pseudomonadota bacterium]|jgi:hypothetical protein